jgi:hypothetical protein
MVGFTFLTADWRMTTESPITLSRYANDFHSGHKSFLVTSQLLSAVYFITLHGAITNIRIFHQLMAVTIVQLKWLSKMTINLKLRPLRILLQVSFSWLTHPCPRRVSNSLHPPNSSWTTFSIFFNYLSWKLFWKARDNGPNYVLARRF